MATFDAAVSGPDAVPDLRLAAHQYNQLLHLLASVDGTVFPVHPAAAARRVFAGMLEAGAPPSEATITSLTCVAAADAEGAYEAFRLVSSMRQKYGLVPRLRSYSPVLAAFQRAGEAGKAYAVEAHMAASAALPEELELAPLLEVGVKARDTDKVFEYMHKLRTLALSHAAGGPRGRWEPGRVPPQNLDLELRRCRPPCWAEEEKKGKKGGTSEVPVERAIEDVDDGSMGEAGEEIMVDALPPEVVDLEREGKVDVRMEAHAVVQDVVVSEAPEVPEPEVKSEEVVVRDTTKVHLAHQPETKADEVLVRDTDTAVVVQEMEAKGEVSGSREAAGAQTTEYDDCIKDCDTVVERGRELHANCTNFKMVSRALARKATALVKLAKSSKDYDVAIDSRRL
ncbi:hypothetical protein CFC21_099731 [Triticum aestivum]|uniref:PROP1-like PPR domain-containing protein n=2 Tax=Triticum aestivum TaxID=4565 RepID=A0A9R1M027_WHEAT|nr:hypothetical protein CFC21_099731 [Triticum aestivum]